MSQTTNDKLIDEATELIPELTGTGLDKAMEANIRRGDMEALYQNVHDAHNLVFDQEYRPGEEF